MKKTPRYYQSEAVDSLMTAINAKRQNNESFKGIIEAGAGAGKTLMMAMCAARLSQKGFNVLIMSRQPVLCSQNYEECWDFGVAAGMYAAKYNKRQVNGLVIVGTEGTIANALKTDFARHRFDLILIDEVHMVDYERANSQFMKIIDHFSEIALKTGKPLQVAGLTGSPYRGIRHIVGDYWQESVYDIGVERLTDQGFLTRPAYGFADNSDNEFHFESVNCLPNSWEFDESELDEIVMSGEGKRRLIGILTEVKAKTLDRNQIIVFASTKRHAGEIKRTLIALGESPDSIGMVTDDTPEKERDQAVEDSKAGRVRWLVNVSCLTTGFDSPLIDVVLFLRPVGSITLLMQCLGRAARLLKPEHEAKGYSKPDYLVLDYAGVFDRLGHLLDNPILAEAEFKRAERERRIIHCPKCASENSDTARRCIAKDPRSYDGRCDYFWKFNECPFCGCHNDIRAGTCRNPSCKRELIDPNEKLLHKSYSDDELVNVTGMTVEAGRGGAIVVKYHLEKPSEYHGEPHELLFDVANKGRHPFRAWLNVHVSESGWRYRIANMKNIGQILSHSELFRVPTKIAYRYNSDKKRFNVGRKVFSND